MTVTNVPARSRTSPCSWCMMVVSWSRGGREREREGRGGGGGGGGGRGPEGWGNGKIKKKIRKPKTAITGGKSNECKCTL